MLNETEDRHRGHIAVALIAIACIAPSAGINVMHQLAHTPGPLALPLATASVLAVALAAASPFAVERATASRNVALLLMALLVGAVCLSYNLSVAIGAASSTRAEITGARTAENQRATLLTGQLAQAEKSRAALAAVSQEKTPGVIRAEISGLEQSKAWTTTKACTDATLPASRTFCQQHASAQAALDAATKVEALDRQIASLKAELLKSGRATGQPADVQAANIAAALAFVGLTVEARNIGVALNLSLAVLVEIIGAFGPVIFAAALRRQPQTGKAKKTPARAKAKATTKAKGKGGRKAAKTRDEALEILRAVARRTDGRIVTSIAALARMLEVSPSTVGDKKKGWLAYWIKTGAVEIEERGVFRVIDRKAA